MENDLVTFKEILKPQVDHIAHQIESKEVGPDDIRFYILGIVAETWRVAYEKGQDDTKLVHYTNATSEARIEAIKQFKNNIAKLRSTYSNNTQEAENPRYWLDKLEEMIEE